MTHVIKISEMGTAKESISVVVTQKYFSPFKIVLFYGQFNWANPQNVKFNLQMYKFIQTPKVISAKLCKNLMRE